MSAQQKPEPGTTVATVDSPEQSFIMRTPIARILTAPSAMSILSKVLPSGASLDRFLYECYHAVTQNPEILECTEQSIILAVGRAIETGLVIGRGVFLVPISTKVSKGNERDRYEKRLQMWVGYQGEIELVRRSGVARHVDGHCVYEKEPFAIQLGTRPSVEHTPILDGTKRGKLIGGYAYAILPGHLLKVFHITLEEVEATRAKSKSWKHLSEAPPWYVIKTAIHRVVKTLPTNPALLKVIALMEREEMEDAADSIDSALPGRESDLGSTPFTLSHERPRQMIAGASEPGGYELNARPEPQPREVAATRAAPPVTDAQRALADQGARQRDPYNPEQGEDEASGAESRQASQRGTSGGSIGGGARAAGPGHAAPSSTEPGSGLATRAQKERIGELLATPGLDLAETEIQRIARVAGAPSYPARDAVREIARLEALLPGGDGLFGEEG